MCIPSATWWENLVFNLGYLIPTSLQGTFTRNRFWVGFWSRVHPDPAAVGFFQRLRKKHRSDVIYLRMLTRRTLLVGDRALVQEVLLRSPAHYVAARPKRDGMAHFQPDAVTISRGDAWEDRRRFNDEVLDYGQLHRFADRFLGVVREEIAPPGRHPPLGTWDDFDKLFARLTRRIIFGDAAQDDETVTESLRSLMREANRPFGRKKSKHFDAFYQRIHHYLATPGPESLVALCVATPSTEATRIANQVPHWMFAMWETLAANVIRALVLVLAHPVAQRRIQEEMKRTDLASAADVAGLRYLAGVVQEAMRLWPTTPMIVRETVVQPLFLGEAIPTGTQLLIHNSFNHRDCQRDPYADWFAPERWVAPEYESEGRPNPLYNHLSSGTQVCAGQDLAIFLAQAVLATVLEHRRPTLVSPRLSPNHPLPHAFDYFRVRFGAAPTADVAPVGGGRPA